MSPLGLVAAAKIPALPPGVTAVEKLEGLATVDQALVPEGTRPMALPGVGAAEGIWMRPRALPPGVVTTRPRALVADEPGAAVPPGEMN
jgi:hypothetical protein